MNGKIRIRIARCVLAFLMPGLLRAQAAPLVDYHQHLFSPAIAKLSPGLQVIDAGDRIKLLDEAGIKRALTLSIAYQYSNPNKPQVEDEYAHVKAENDWTSQQVARFPDRLRGFCGVNPLREYALQEIERCAKDPRLHTGLKMHFGNSDVQLENPDHLEKLKQVFRAANDHQMAIVVHMHSSVTRKRAYGARQAQMFLDRLLPAAPDVPVQIAHLAGSGGYDDPTVDEALAIFIQAVENRDPRMAHVYFDVSGVAGSGQWAGKVGVIATRIRQLGVSRILFGSDGAGGGNLTPREAWAAFRKLPLSEAEFHTIESNIAPYMQ